MSEPLVSALEIMCTGLRVLHQVSCCGGSARLGSALVAQSAHRRLWDETQASILGRGEQAWEGCLAMLRVTKLFPAWVFRVQGWGCWMTTAMTRACPSHRSFPEHSKPHAH